MSESGPISLMKRMRAAIGAFRAATQELKIRTPESIKNSKELEAMAKNIDFTPQSKDTSRPTGE